MGTSRIVWTDLALALLVVSGREGRVSLGATCEPSTDCPWPLRCRSERCRTACREARDCAFPLECIRDSTGNGGCRARDDARWQPCSSAECAEGLDCVCSLYAEGACLAHCEDDGDCMAGREACYRSQTRTAVGHLGATRTVGVCIPTCDEVLDRPEGLPGPLRRDGSCLRR
jgi:hypothetical protein